MYCHYEQLPDYRMFQLDSIILCIWIYLCVLFRDEMCTSHIIIGLEMLYVNSLRSVYVDDIQIRTYHNYVFLPIGPLLVIVWIAKVIWC